MAMTFKRPILVGGLGLTFGLWALESLQHSLLSGGSNVVVGAIVVGSGIWWLQRRPTARKELLSLNLPPVNREQVEQAFQGVKGTIEQLVAEQALVSVPVSSQREAPVGEFRDRLQTLRTGLERRDLQVAVIGGPGTGKTNLVQRLQEQGIAGQGQVFLQDAPNFFTTAQATSGKSGESIDLTSIQTADLVIFVTSGDLTEPELQILQNLSAVRHRLVVAFNKQDQYLPADRLSIVQQLQARLQSFIPSLDVVAIAAAPNPVKVRQHQADGRMQEWLEQPEPEITPLVNRLHAILSQEHQPLVLATGWRQAKALQTEVQRALNAVRRDRTLPAIEQYQWIAAAAAFANPVPSLDLLATAAISSQLVVDLGAVYGQRFSLQQAKTVAANLAGQMVKLGLVELSTQALSAVLKGHVVTFVAGGLLQGLSAAYLTRLAGLSLIEFFEEQSLTDSSTVSTTFAVDQITQKLQTVFQQMRQGAFIQTLVQQGLQRFVPDAKSSALPQSALQPIALSAPEMQAVQQQ